MRANPLFLLRNVKICTSSDRAPRSRRVRRPAQKTGRRIATVRKIASALGLQQKASCSSCRGADEHFLGRLQSRHVEKVAISPAMRVFFSLLLQREKRKAKT